MDRLIIGCGYLGRRVLALWRGEGARVFATTRSSAHADELRDLGAIPLICDILDPESLKKLPAAGTVLVCVGLDRSAGRSMREVYVGGLGNVLKRLPPPGRLLYVSSTGVYGQSGGEEVDESAPTEPHEESGRVVLEAERLLRSRLPDAVVLRFAGIYGPGRVLRRQAIQAGEPMAGDGEKWLNLIHVEDGAAAVLAAEAHAQPGGVYNVCDDRPVRRREFYAGLAQLLGAPEPRFLPLSPGPHDANRRINNRRMRQELQVELQYPDYREGLPASI